MPLGWYSRGGERPPLALGVRARVVQALLRQRRVARHIRRLLRHESHRHQVGLDPPLRPKERVRRAHLALQLPEERVGHAILPPVAHQLLLLRGVPTIEALPQAIRGCSRRLLMEYLEDWARMRV